MGLADIFLAAALQARSVPVPVPIPAAPSGKRVSAEAGAAAVRKKAVADKLAAAAQALDGAEARSKALSKTADAARSRWFCQKSISGGGLKAVRAAQEAHAEATAQARAAGTTVDRCRREFVAALAEFEAGQS